MASTFATGTHTRGLCGCGGFHAESEDALGAAVDAALLGGLFPDSVLRRTLLKAVGATTLLAALSDLLPIGTLHAVALERAAPEKTKLDVGFLPITCATPLIMGFERGTFAKQRFESSRARRHFPHGSSISY